MGGGPAGPVELGHEPSLSHRGVTLILLPGPCALRARGLELAGLGASRGRARELQPVHLSSPRQAGHSAHNRGRHRPRRRSRPRRRRTGSRRGARAAASAPQKASPAAVVSTASTGCARERTGLSPRLGHESPVLAQSKDHGATAPAEEPSRPPRPGLRLPLRAMASVSFGTTTSTRRRAAEGGGPGAGRGVEQCRRSRRPGAGKGRLHDSHGHLQLRQRHRARAEQRPRGHVGLGPRSWFAPAATTIVFAATSRHGYQGCPARDAGRGAVVLAWMPSSDQHLEKPPPGMSSPMQPTMTTSAP